MQRLRAGGGATARHDHVARLHEQVHDLGEAVEVAIELRVVGAPVDEFVVGVLVAATDHDGLAAVGVPHKFGQKIEVIVGAVAAVARKTVKRSGRSPSCFPGSGRAPPAG